MSLKATDQRTLQDLSVVIISSTGIARWNHICGPAKVMSVTNAAQVIFSIDHVFIFCCSYHNNANEATNYSFPQSSPLTLRKQIKWKTANVTGITDTIRLVNRNS